MPRGRAIQQMRAQSTTAAIGAEIAFRRGKITQQSLGLRDFTQGFSGATVAKRCAMGQGVIANHMAGIPHPFGKCPATRRA